MTKLRHWSVTYQDNTYSVISAVQLGEAYNRWQQCPHLDPGKAFMGYLGISTWAPNKPHSDTFHFSPEAARKLQLLLTPNYLTIIKAWYAKNEQTA